MDLQGQIRMPSLFIIIIIIIKLGEQHIICLIFFYIKNNK